MASAFSHALVAFSLGKSYRENTATYKFFLLGVFCAVIPDADVLMFNFVTYSHPLGHRGFFHSFFFCLLLSALIVLLFYRKNSDKMKLGFYFFLCGASHGLLDMLTNGGRGVAIFSPFSNERFFFPWRPIQVSPIGLKNFFGEWGVKVLLSEMIWIGIPCVIFLTLLKFFRK